MVFTGTRRGEKARPRIPVTEVEQPAAVETPATDTERHAPIESSTARSRVPEITHVTGRKTDRRGLLGKFVVSPEGAAAERGPAANDADGRVLALRRIVREAG
ncbi:hypothetical protein [Nocardia sp. NPDC057668]|uniref:hypothetical protein n=1 Tax=Nocardia sp. NPDC057668 TaxID=3346202 RepID=UPI00366DFF80